eukprot:scaffold8023_cov54-Attheya_sp.AAC.6
MGCMPWSYANHKVMLLRAQDLAKYGSIAEAKSTRSCSLKKDIPRRSNKCILIKNMFSSYSLNVVHNEPSIFPGYDAYGGSESTPNSFPSPPYPHLDESSTNIEVDHSDLLI